MAYAALVSLAQTIDQILNHDPLSISIYQKKRIISIDKYVISLQAFLEYFSEKDNTDLEGKIRDVSTEAEYVIECFLWRKQYESRYGHWSRYHDDLDELKRVAEEFDSIVEEVMEIKDTFRIKEIINTVDSPAADTSSSSSSRLAPPHQKDAMVGFDDHLLAIKHRLCGESSKLQVIPIVGMGGIGKTTLATNAYHHPLITGHFDIRAWVTVSQDYSPQRILSSLLDSMKEFINTERYDVSNEVKVYQSLKKRRYLIVLDDMWSTKAWDDIMRILPDDDNGSRIMLTTRLSDVAAYADSCSRVHEMHLMDADQSWDLLRHRVFSHEEECPPDLEYTGKEIARRCGGLPLAIAVIAGLLSTRETRALWQEIAEDVKSAFHTTKDGLIEKILSLSYTHLPHYLRPCFLYMGAFPEDYEIKVSKLIRLWVAEGFLKYANGSKSYEEMAEEYLEDLVKRSLVFVNRLKSNGKIKSCSVHDLVWDLCVRKAKEVRIFNQSCEKQRRICSGLNFTNDIAGNSTNNLRAFIFFWSESGKYFRLGYFRLLRILDMGHTYANSPPPVEVFKLFRLRYLALHCNHRMIPADISNLQNLQTLIIKHKMEKQRGWYSRSDLPLEIWKMRQLRHLVSSNAALVPFLEEDTSTWALENLVTLTISLIASTVGVFKLVPNLKRLNITYIELGFRNRDYHLDELVHLNQLENLTVNQLGPSSCRVMFNPAFPRTLKKLTLKGYCLPWDEDMMRNVGSLPNLQVLKLRDASFSGKKWETKEGEFCQLKFLLIQDWYLKEWITEGSHFPTLKCLSLHHCLELIEIPDGIGEIPTLELIEIKGYKRSLVESAKRIQKEQQEFGNDSLQLRLMIGS